MKYIFYTFIGVMVLFVIVDHFTAYTTIVHAQERPQTNRGICIEIQQHGAFVKGGSIEGLIKTCAKEGITI